MWDFCQWRKKKQKQGDTEVFNFLPNGENTDRRGAKMCGLCIRSLNSPRNLNEKKKHDKLLLPGNTVMKNLQHRSINFMHHCIVEANNIVVIGAKIKRIYDGIEAEKKEISG